MKLFFRYLTYIGVTLLFTTNLAFARHLIVIAHWQDGERAELVKKKIHEEKGIPLSFLEIIEIVNPCMGEEQGLLWLCFDENHQLQVAKRSPYFRQQSLVVFEQNKKAQDDLGQL